MLLHQLITLATTQGAQQMAAKRVLAALLPCIGGSLKDERQAQVLLSLAYALATGTATAAPSSSAAAPLPHDMELASKLVDAALSSGKPAVSMSACRLAVAYHSLALGVGDGGSWLEAAGPVKSCGLLALVGCVLARLGHATACEGLGRLQVSVASSCCI